MDRLAKLFVLNRAGPNLKRGAVVFGGMLVPFVVLTALDQQQYFLPAAFATLFAAMCDPGGEYRTRVQMMAGMAVAGALLTGLGFAVGQADQPTAGAGGSEAVRRGRRCVLAPERRNHHRRAICEAWHHLALCQHRSRQRLGGNPDAVWRYRRRDSADAFYPSAVLAPSGNVARFAARPQ